MVLLKLASPGRNDFFRRRQTDSLSLIDRVSARDIHCLPRDTPNFRGRNFTTRRESPGAFEEHAHTEPEILTARDVLHLLLPRRDRFSAIAVDAYVSVGRAEFAGLIQGDIREGILIDCLSCNGLRFSNLADPGG